MLLKADLFSTLFIDIRGEVVRVVQGKTMDENLNFTVDKFGSVILPGHLGPHADSRLIAENAARLEDFLAERKMKAKRVIAGLGHSGVITRNVRVPKMSPGDLDNMMKLNINDYLPVSPEDYAFDYKVLDEIEEDGSEFLDLMVAAVSHDQAEQCYSLLEQAGLRPVVFDVLPNMLHRLFGHLANRDIMVLDGSAGGTCLAVFKGKTLFVYADIPFAVKPDGENDLSVLAGEMRGYLDYFSSRNFGRTVDNVAVLGELAVLPGIGEMQELIGSIPVTAGLSQAGDFSFKGKANNFHELAAVYAGNLGLMMRDSKFRPGDSVPVNSGMELPSGSRAVGA